ncbi:hypothetical protein J4455_00095 [Candidatus Woesearchaeota archaeon]|nr:hypothetical protein [Candidatus Woesearchaeota archaeon]
MEIDQVEHKLENPNNSNKGIILLPGVSGKALADPRYNLLSSALINANFGFLRFDLWKSVSELDKMTISEIQDFLDKAFDFMQNKGFTEISLIGKSFGGGILLTYINPKIKKLVLWSPAINYSRESNFIFTKETKLYTFKSFMDIKINKRDLYHINYPVLILHGTKDEVMLFENSEKIVQELPKIVLKPIHDSDNSYSNETWLNEIIEETIEFLK